MTRLIARERVMALAGLFQAAALVDQVAVSGCVDVDDVEPLLNSLLTIEPDSFESVYGDTRRLKLGLSALLDQLSRRPSGQSASPRPRAVAYYAAALLHMQKRVARHDQLVDRLARGVERIRRQADYLGKSHDNVVAALADLYRELAAASKVSITVRGHVDHLGSERNANLVRALLLSGLRSAWLWRQHGGTQLGLLLQRKRVVNTARRLLFASGPGNA